jgi:hypothetical protein
MRLNNTHIKHIGLTAVAVDMSHASNGDALSHTLTHLVLRLLACQTALQVIANIIHNLSGFDATFRHCGY